MTKFRTTTYYPVGVFRVLMMKALLFVGSFFCLREVSAESLQSATGYLIDNQCLLKCKDAGADAKCTPDEVNVYYNPQDHTGWCLELGACVASGYSLMSELPTADNGKHSVLLSLEGPASQEAAVQYIHKGHKGPFPKVTVVFDQDLATTQADTGILQAMNATITDPWNLMVLQTIPNATTNMTFDYWKGETTTQIICPDSSSPDIVKNNYCYRSDVAVAESGSTSIIIESNGCPDHASMQGGSGTIANFQKDPTAGGAAYAECEAESDSNACYHDCDAKDPCAADCADACACNPCADKPSTTCGDCSCSTNVEEQNESNLLTEEGCAAAINDCGDAQEPPPGNEPLAVERAGAIKNIFSPNHRFLNESISSGGGTCNATCSPGSYGNATCSPGSYGNATCSPGHGCGAGCSSKNTTCGSGCGACACACACASGCGCGCGCGSKECGCGCGTTHGTYEPLFQHYTMVIPKNPVVKEATKIKDDVVGIMVNGVVLDSHKQTWAYDSCNGHSDKKHQYHYHIPPICLFKSLGIPFADSPSWWINDEGNATRTFADMASQFPQFDQMAGAVSPIVGFARDGHPIYGLYDSTGALQRSAAFGGTLDECNGKKDPQTSTYGYYITPDPPFAPPCLMGEIGLFTYATSNVACPKDGIKNTIVNPGSGAGESSGTGGGYKPDPTTPAPGAANNNNTDGGNATDTTKSGGTTIRRRSSLIVGSSLTSFVALSVLLML